MLIERGVDLVGEIIGEIVGDTLEAALDCQQKQFLAILEQQDARLAALLERQATIHSQEMASLAEANAENIRAILREVLSARPPTPMQLSTEEPSPGPAASFEVVADLQETLRLGFGEIRGGLNQHHNEVMMVVRNELRPLAQAALAWLVGQARAPTSAPVAQAPGGEATTSPPPGVEEPPAATSEKPRPPPSQRELQLTAAQRQHVHLAIADDGERDDPHDAEDGGDSPPLRYRPPDDRSSATSEARP